MNSITKLLVLIAFRHFTAAIRKLCDLHCRLRKFLTQIRFCSGYQATFGSSCDRNSERDSSGKPVSKAMVFRVIS